MKECFEIREDHDLISITKVKIMKKNVVMAKPAGKKHENE